MLLPRMWYLISIQWLFLLASSSIGLIQVRSQEGPLFASSRWIVDGEGRRVKLACVNWPSHLQPVLAEGLNMQPVDNIMKLVNDMGFNCVRFTWPLELATKETLASTTVKQMFTWLGLNQSLANITTHNPWVVDLTIADAFETMLERFQQNKLMVVLDNHITVPGWCCGLNDGNGFFGDRFFDPSVWMKGLNKMALLATKFPNVIGMSLRNELRGPKSDVDLWYMYVRQGAETVHAANPNVLVILSGLDYDKDLSFIHKRPVNVSFTGKVVFEHHWYSFSHSGAWKGNLNDACGWISASIMDKAGFIADEDRAPMFESEFGINAQKGDVNDDRYINCFMAMAADQDWDFAVWALQGSYYFREGVVGMDEWYGLLNYEWNDVRNPTWLKRLSSLQKPFRGPEMKQSPTNDGVLFHPQTGLCVLEGKDAGWSLSLGPCNDATGWTYTPQETFLLKGRNQFLQAAGAQKPVQLVKSEPLASRWNQTSNSKLHLSAKAADGIMVCLDVDGVNLVTNECKCLAVDSSCDPTSQWFKLVKSSHI
ncbi:hypothetical protein SAY86_003060 [Trapa natans]|uniref:Glycoside hydrolase family 5 domain-containing protein n=1 Tax=Trapa natans TaxID=22666 RepID=A0AAN7LHB1_TRANT|nr:hypothetical protein SAY86_003060 [Trapa natans]